MWKPGSGSSFSRITSPCRTYYRQDLQVPLAGRTLLQVDQAAPADQGLLWHQRERSEDANLDCSLGLRPGGHRPQALGVGGEPLPDSTDSERNAFRENAILRALQASDFENELANPGNQLILFDF